MKWEYYRLSAVESSLDESLHELGKDGWELVAVLAETRLFHGFQCLLKRPYTDEAAPRRGLSQPQRAAGSSRVSSEYRRPSAANGARG